MSNAICPKAMPEAAAQEVLLAMIEAGKTGQMHHGERYALELIDLHKAITAYYRTLHEEQ